MSTFPIELCNERFDQCRLSWRAIAPPRLLDALVDRKHEIQMSATIMSETQSPTVDSPPEILPRIAAGDHTAVNDCVDRYGGLIWSMARRQLGSDADADDATQDVFIELWQKSESFDPDRASEKTFIAMIARRRLIDRQRRCRAPVANAPPEEMLDVSQPPEPDRVELSDEAAKAFACLKKLSANQQRVLELSIHGGQSHAKISERLRMPLGTVKSFARRGLVMLRDCMLRNDALSSRSLPIGGSEA